MCVGGLGVGVISLHLKACLRSRYIMGIFGGGGGVTKITPMRAFEGVCCSGTYLCSKCVKHGISTTRAHEHLH